PKIELLLRVAHRLRELGCEALDQAVDLSVELLPRDGRIDEAPFRCCARRDLLAEEEDLAGATLAHHDGEPLSRSAGGDRTVPGPDRSGEGGGNDTREVAR